MTLTRIFYSLVIAVLLSTSGCAVNPVTGRNELAFTSQEEEVRIGSSQYVPTQQSEGGQYYLDPELNRYVSDIGQALAKHSVRSSLPYEFVILNNSVPNAWALPGGKIAINRGLLLELSDEAELAAVLGHEITHADARHSAKSMDKGALMSVGLAVLGVAAVASDMDNPGLVMAGAAVGAQAIQAKYGRDDELEADFYGMQHMAKAGYDPEGAVDLQQTFVRLSEGRQSDWLSGFFASHPPSQARVEANRQTATTLGSGGKRNREGYQAMIAKLKADAPAYAAYDKGQAAMQKKDYAGAQKLAEQAIALQPDEALFYELKGMSLHARDNYQGALKEYNKAVQLNGNYFSHYLYRGLVKEQLRDRDGARQDYSASQKLLPTKLASQRLQQLGAN